MKIKSKLYKYSLLFVIVLIFIINGIYFYARLKPKLDIHNVNSFYLYTKNNELYYQGSNSKEWESIDQISPNLIKTTIKAKIVCFIFSSF